MSILSNIEIEKLIKTSKLIENGDTSQIGAACYELRAGTTYFDLTENNLRIDINWTGSIIIKPWHRVVIMTQETLNMPNNLLAKITSKGSLFSVGLSAVNTQADPGFKGQIGVVTQNFSDKYIKINVGQSIVKADFSELSSPTSKPYSGQHGFKSNIWPIVSSLQKSHEDVATDRRVESKTLEAYKVLPEEISSIVKSLSKHQKTVNLLLVGAMFLNTTTLILMLLPTQIIENTTGIIINIISQLIISAFVLFWRQKT